MAMHIEKSTKALTYEQDDGPLTDAQYQAIRAVSSASGTPDYLFTECLIGFEQFIAKPNCESLTRENN